MKRKFQKNQLVIILMTAIISTLCSCAHPLDREKAKELISQNIGLPKDETVTFHLVLFPSQVNVSDYKELIDSEYINAPKTVKVVTTPLVPQGIDYIHIDLTEKGSSFTRGKDPNNSDTHYMMKGAESYIVEVTEIKESEDKKSCEVKYITDYRNINAFGRFYKKSQNLPNLFTQRSTHTASFRYYDNNWILEK